MDYRKLSLDAAALIKTYGLAVKLSRGGSQFASTYGLFTEAKSEDEGSSSSSLLAQTTVSKRTLLVAGSTEEPFVGDYVSCSNGTFSITAVERIQPSSVTVLYKLELS